MTSTDQTAQAIQHLGLEVFSAEWYRAYKAEHLRRYPNLYDEPHQTSINNLDQSIRIAEERETNKGHAGLAVKIYRPRCNFGSGHMWVMPADHEELSQCAKCGCVSSQHPAFKS